MAPIWKFILLTVLVGFISVPCFKAADKDNEWIIDKVRKYVYFSFMSVYQYNIADLGYS